MHEDSSIPPFLVSARAAFQIKFRASAHVLKMSRDPYKNGNEISFFSLFGYVIRCLNIWKLIRKYQFRLPYFGRKFYSLAVRAERKLLEAWQRLTYAWKWCDNRDFRTFFTLSTIVNKNYKTGECQGLKWRTKHGIKKTKKAKGRKEMHPARKETCKSANEKLNIFNLTDLKNLRQKI